MKVILEAGLSDKYGLMAIKEIEMPFVPFVGLLVVTPEGESFRVGATACMWDMSDGEGVFRVRLTHALTLAETDGKKWKIIEI